MRFLSIPLALTLILMSFGIASTSAWYVEQKAEFEQKQMDIQVNYSVDAAMQEMLTSTNDIGLDYVDFAKIKVDPQVAYDTYVKMLVSSFGWSNSKENYDYIQYDMIPFFCVVSNDGYYMKIKSKSEDVVNGVTNDTYPLNWTPKIPFTLVKDGSLYNITLSGTIPSAVKNNKLLINYSGGDLTTAERKAYIAKQLTYACNQALVTGSDALTDANILFPDTLSETRMANAIESTSIITYLFDKTESSKRFKGAFGVGGSRIDNADFRIGYTRNGKKLYTYPYNRSILESQGIVIENVFTSDREAAESGAYFDIEFSLRR